MQEHKAHVHLYSGLFIACWRSHTVSAYNSALYGNLNFVQICARSVSYSPRPATHDLDLVDRTDRTDHTDHTDHTDRTDHTDHTDHTNHSDRTDHTDHTDYTNHTDRTDHTYHTNHRDIQIIQIIDARGYARFRRVDCCRVRTFTRVYMSR